MPAPMTRAQVITYVEARVAYLKYPTLDPTTEIDTIVDQNLRYTTWAPATSYIVGDVIVPTVRNAHQYRCIYAGTSGTTEPQWTSFLDYLSSATGFVYYTSAMRYRNTDLIIGDAQMQWQEFGPDFREDYDLFRIINECWLMKAAKVADDFKFATDLQIFERQQVYDHCIDQAGKWAPQRIA